MKRRVMELLLTAGLIGTCGGCIESKTLVAVNKDGSGTLTLREFLSPEVSKMMSGMGDMMTAMATNMEAAVVKPVAPGDMFKNDARKKAAKYGEDVTMTNYKCLTNAAGWQGYEATYAFKDVNRITVSPGDVEEGNAGNGGPAMQGSTAYRFKFTPGSPASLTVEEVKEKADKPAGKPAAAPAGNEGTVAVTGGEGMEAMGAEMMQTMAPMLKGMRIAMLVQVDGKITETNAKYKSPLVPNVVVLMDVPMDKLLGNPDAMKLMTSNKPEDKAKLTKMDIPGVRMEEEGKIVAIKFE